MHLLRCLAVLTQALFGYHNIVTASSIPISSSSVGPPVDGIQSIIDNVPIAVNEFGKMTDSPKKVTLPPLPYPYDALEPYISKQIMELHHKKHHQAYVNNLNAALADHVTALSSNNVKKQIELQQAIKFNGGGHINHSLFWANLSPPNKPASSISAAPKLKEAIENRWGSYDAFKETFSKSLLGIQGSGWGWLVKDRNRGVLSIETTKDQDPVVGDKVPVFGVDMWEHAYYIQYLNDKASYVKGIWNVINWETAESRFKDEGAAANALKL